METFEEWFKYSEQRAIEEMGEIAEYHDNFVLKNMCESVWDHQQDKINKLKKEYELANKDFWRMKEHSDKLQANLDKAVECIERCANEALDCGVYLEGWQIRDITNEFLSKRER